MLLYHYVKFCPEKKIYANKRAKRECLKTLVFCFFPSFFIGSWDNNSANCLIKTNFKMKPFKNVGSVIENLKRIEKKVLTNMARKVVFMIFK